jgi:hypothetical protein
MAAYGPKITLVMKNITLSVVIRGDAGGYFVCCPALQGCYSQDDAYEEAVENIQDPVRCMKTVLPMAKRSDCRRAIQTIAIFAGGFYSPCRESAHAGGFAPLHSMPRSRSASNLVRFVRTPFAIGLRHALAPAPPSYRKAAAQRLGQRWRRASR